MRDRLARLAIAVVLLVAFVGDQRVVAPVLAALLAVAVWREVVLSRLVAASGVLALVAATVAFETDNEVAAWTIVLAVAAAAGVSVASATGRPAPAR